MLKGARGLEWLLLMACVALALIMLLRDGDGGSAVTPLEARLESALSAVNGAGRVRVLVNETGDGQIQGVLIVAEGAGDLRVRLELEQAAHAILNVDLNNVEVLVGAE